MSSLYCGIDLHSNNHVIVIIDNEDKRLYEKRLPNDLAQTLTALEPYKTKLESCVVESTFNWYWLVDGLMDHGYNAVLANPTACAQQYSGLKYSDDKHDAFWLAHMRRLGILPTGYIYPSEQRALRDLLRRRLQLVTFRAKQLTCIQMQIWRSSGVRIKSTEIRKKSFTIPFLDGALLQAAQANLTLLRTVESQIKQLEQELLDKLELAPEFNVLKTIKGVGDILALTIMLETGDIQRFASVGQYASYCRCVKSTRMSNQKQKGRGNSKSGNRYLSWAFSEAAHFAIRYDEIVNAFYQRKKAKTNGMIAVRAVAHKLARAAYCMMNNQTEYDSKRAFA